VSFVHLQRGEQLEDAMRRAAEAHAERASLHELSTRLSSGVPHHEAQASAEAVRQGILEGDGREWLPGVSLDLADADLESIFAAAGLSSDSVRCHSPLLSRRTPPVPHASFHAAQWREGRAEQPAA